MKKCNHCNADNLDQSRFCESCGIKFEEIFESKVEEPTVTVEPVIQEVVNKTSTVENNETINGEANPPQQPAQNAEPTYSYAPTSIPYFTERKHGGLTAFSIINICSIIFSVITLYASVFTTVFGIIALVTLNKAKNETSDEYYKIHKRNALILNIVGISLAALGFIAFIGLVFYFVVNGLSDFMTTVL